MTENKGLLPHVSDGVSMAVRMEMKNYTGDEYLINLMERMNEKNKRVADYLESFSQEFENPKAILYCGAFVHRMLEMSGFLTEVSEGIERIVREEIEEKGKPKFASDVIRTLGEDNSFLYIFIDEYVTGSQNPDAIKFAGTVVYRFHERQAESEFIENKPYSTDKSEYPETWKMRGRLNYAIEHDMHELEEQLRNRINQTHERLL